MTKGPKGKYAWTARMGEKGQIVIPKEARELFGFQPGDTLLLLGDEKRGIAIVRQDQFSALAELVFRKENSHESDSDHGADEKI